VKKRLPADFPALHILDRKGTETGRNSSGAGLNGSARDHTLCAPCARLIALPFPLNLPIQGSMYPETGMLRWADALPRSREERFSFSLPVKRA
jgi:hypothetical protein